MKPIFLPLLSLFFVLISTAGAAPWVSVVQPIPTPGKDVMDRATVVFSMDDRAQGLSVDLMEVAFEKPQLMNDVRLLVHVYPIGAREPSAGLYWNTLINVRHVKETRLHRNTLTVQVEEDVLTYPEEIVTKDSTYRMTYSGKELSISR